MLRKSTCLKISAASRAAAGTSIITPIVWRPNPRARFGKPLGLLDDGHHRSHHPKLCVGYLGLGGSQRFELTVENVREPTTGPQTSDAESRVLLLADVQERQRLVGSGVEGADHNLATLRLSQHGGVSLALLVQTRRSLMTKEEEFGSEQTNPFKGLVVVANVGQILV